MLVDYGFLGFGLLLDGQRRVYFVQCTQPIESGLVVVLCVQLEEFADCEDRGVDLERFIGWLDLADWMLLWFLLFF